MQRIQPSKEKKNSFPFCFRYMFNKNLLVYRIRNLVKIYAIWRFHNWRLYSIGLDILLVRNSVDK